MGIANSRRFIWIAVFEAVLVEDLASRLVFLEGGGALVLFFVDFLLCDYNLGDALSMHRHGHTKHNSVIVIFALAVLICQYQVLTV
jgi:hypothetical protein